MQLWLHTDATQCAIHRWPCVNKMIRDAGIALNLLIIDCKDRGQIKQEDTHQLPSGISMPKTQIIVKIR